MTYIFAKNSIVKIWFKNGPISFIEGKVIELTDDLVALTSPKGGGEMIIFKPQENILMINILNDISEKSEETKYTIIKNLDKQENDNITINESAAAPAIDNKKLSRIAKLVQDKILKANEEKLVIAQQMGSSVDQNNTISLDYSKPPPIIETPYYTNPLIEVK